MQVARLLEETGTGRLSGKLRQMRVAWALEQRLTKDDILGLYLLLAPYGGNLEGVRAASLAWFGKEPKRLSTAEAALLVALPQLPEKRRPDRYRERGVKLLRTDRCGAWTWLAARPPADAAAPLLCAGITVYPPLKDYAGPGKEIGVIGLGGLGHVAVRIAKAMGSRVTVFSHSPSKEADARRLGADAFASSTDTRAFKAMRMSFDMILSTVSAPIDVDGGDFDGGFVEFLAGKEYSIADIATLPWAGRHEWHGIDLANYPNVKRWYDIVNARPAVTKGMAVPYLN